MLLNPRVVPLIGQDTYDALVRLFRAPDRQRLGRPAQHLLSGILRCHCGQAMYVVYSSRTPTNQQTVYRCPKAKGSGGRSNGCGRVSVSERGADRWAGEAFIAAVAGPRLAQHVAARLEALHAGGPTPEELAREREELAELEQILPTRFATDQHRARHAELSARARQAEERMRQQPDLEALASLPRVESELRAAWEGWTVPERRVWLRRLLERITVKPSTQRGRGSDITKRLDPTWKV
jgi:hypothetical protein